MLVDRRDGRHLRCLVGVLAAVLAATVPVYAQSSPPVAASLDSSTVGRVPFSRMHTLLEKTLFQVDVLVVDVWLGDETAERLANLAAGQRYSNEVADSVARVVIGSQDAFIRVDFLRDIGLGRFLDGADENLRRVLRAGIITEADYEMISAGMPVWYSFLEGRGILDGDQMRYRIRGDTLRTRFLSLKGELLLDQIDVGPERRRSVLGSYFVRESDFRAGLIRSLFDEGG